MPLATYAFGGKRSNVGSVGGAPDINDARQDHLVDREEARLAVRPEMTAAVSRPIHGIRNLSCEMSSSRLRLC
jgi:hypothetical protein